MWEKLGKKKDSKFVRFVNLLYYFTHRANLVFGSIITYPVDLIVGLKGVRKFYKKRGVDDPITMVNEILNDLEMGFAIYMTFGLFLIFFVIAFFGLSNFILFVFDIDFEIMAPYINKWVVVGIVGLIAAFMTYLLEYKDRYIKYFKEFDKMPRKEKVKWAWISYLTMLGIFVSSICMFLYNVGEIG